MKDRSVSVVLSAVLLAAFAVEVARGAAGNEAALLGLGALPQSGNLRGEYWRLLTYSLLHLNAGHLVVNVAALLWLGYIVQRRLGARWTAILYLGCVIGAGVIIVAADALHPREGAGVGASGGIVGLLGAAIVLLHRPDAVRMFGAAARVRTVLWSILGLALAASLLPGVSMSGHVGGLAAGLLAGWFAPLDERK